MFTHWHLKQEQGRELWIYDGPEDPASLEKMSDCFFYDKKDNSNSGDLVYRQLQLDSVTPNQESDILDKHEFSDNFSRRVFKQAYNATYFYSALQSNEGSWKGDYGGPLFLLPGLILVSYVTETPFCAPYQELMKRYILNHQNEDGGWGLHIEGTSTVLGSVLNYVALRLLGKKTIDPALNRARKWILDHGGANHIPSWGKFYLSLLGIYDWKGCHAILPEWWLLPSSWYLHPSHQWCHSRMVYLAIAYCYGYKVVGSITKLVIQLRSEIYLDNYETINWNNAKNECANTDLYSKPSILLKLVHAVSDLYEVIYSKKLRKKSLDFCLSYINFEDIYTCFIDLGPVTQVINSVCIWHAYGKQSHLFKRHVERWSDYLWLAEDGLKMNSYHSSQLWNTSFATQAILAGKNSGEYFRDTLNKAYTFISKNQINSQISKCRLFFYHHSIGGWTFSDKNQGWPVTDCTAEALKAVLKIDLTGIRGSALVLSSKNLKQTVDLILSWQNKDGGWATYERIRGPKWMEWLNDSAIFGPIVVERSYTECSSSCIQALVCFQKQMPNYRAEEIKKAIQRGVKFILSQQLPDGSWYGSWGVCFTYGSWFAIEGLKEVGADVYMSASQLAIEKGCAFLISKQNPDGGWGESFESCVQKKYIQHSKSQVVNTAWAVLALMKANWRDHSAIQKAIQLLMDRQLANGDWNQEGISAVFNQNCALTYSEYRNIFPLWALNRYHSLYSAGNMS